MRWVSAISRHENLDVALADVAEQAARGLDQIEPDVAFVFLDQHFAPLAERVARQLGPWLGSALLVGVSAHGVIGDAEEVEDERAVALLAGVLPDVEIEARHVEQSVLGIAAADANAWRSVVGTELHEPSFVVLTDPYSLDPAALLAGLDAAHPGATKVGGVASGGRTPGSSALLLGSDVYRSGGIVVAFGGNVRIDAVVAQGCRPIGEPHFVTSCHEHLLRELDGRSPRDVLTALYERLPPSDQALFADSLFVGLAMPGEHRELHVGDFLVRGILGLDPDTGALWLASELEPNSILQFQLRDAATSAKDLERQLARFRARGQADRASAALLVSCVGRGAGLYGAANHDSRAFTRLVADVPLAGFFAGGEFGPVGGRTYVHGYTSAFGVFRPKQ